MGGDSSKSTKPVVLCEGCEAECNFSLTIACQKNFCLLCHLKHFQTCQTCPNAEMPGDPYSKEIRSFMDYINSEMETKKNYGRSLESRISTLTAKLTACQHAVVISEHISNKRTVELAGKQQTIDVLRQQISSLTMQLNTAKQTNAGLNEENKKLRDSNAELENTCRQNAVAMEEQRILLDDLKRLQRSPTDLDPTPKFPVSQHRTRGGRRGGLVGRIGTSGVGCKEDPETKPSDDTFNDDEKKHLPLQPDPSSRRRYFMNFSVQGKHFGKIVIETRFESAPKMCETFHNFFTGNGGIYLGSQVVKVSPKNYIVIQNATVKGDAISYPPDENDLEIRRGAVGMRVQGFDGDKKLVKSQFYIVLGESEPADRYFSYVFGYVIEGCDVCDLVSESNSSQQKFTISDLGLVS